MSTATQEDYAREIAQLVETMPIERAAQVYDFARFLKSVPQATPSPISNEDDWLNDTPEQIAAEDAKWDVAYVRNRDKIRAAANEAVQSYRAGETDELFDEHGNVRS